ncbi:SLBB domain-containing protein, partial [bacterium]|nr:SLBB domain-containing protein [bacterium]
VFTVMGLVNKPDAYDYPPDVQYNLMEALAFAGGLDMVADPRYVKVFRQEASGEVVQAVFGVGGKTLTDAYSVTIKPGDVIYVDHTLRTRMNKFLADVFHITVGANVNAANLK